MPRYVIRHSTGYFNTTPDDDSGKVISDDVSIRCCLVVFCGKSCHHTIWWMMPSGGWWNSDELYSICISGIFHFYSLDRTQKNSELTTQEFVYLTLCFTKKLFMYIKHSHFENGSRRHLLRQNYLSLAEMPP